MPFQIRGRETLTWGRDKRHRRGAGTRASALCARVLRSEYQALTRAVPYPIPEIRIRSVFFGFSPLTWGSVTRNWRRGFRPRNVDDARRAGYVMLRREGDFILRLSTRATYRATRLDGAVCATCHWQLASSFSSSFWVVSFQSLACCLALRRRSCAGL